MEAEWPAARYDDARNSCRHFCSELCRKLGVACLAFIIIIIIIINIIININIIIIIIIFLLLIIIILIIIYLFLILLLIIILRGLVAGGGGPKRSVRERGSAPKGGRHSTIFLILGENSACQVPICAVAA